MKQTLLLSFFLICLVAFTQGQVQDYEKMIIGKWEMTFLIMDGQEIPADLVPETFWIKFTEDGKMSLKFEEDEETADYVIKGNAIYEKDNEEEGKMIIQEISNEKLKLEFVSNDSDETFTMIFKRT